MHLPKAGADWEKELHSEVQTSWQWPCSRLEANMELMSLPIQVCGQILQASVATGSEQNLKALPLELRGV